MEVEFLFDNNLIAALENLIRNAKKSLLLVSPFIDLDARIIDALNEKKTQHDFELLVLFGKNENNFYKSIKKDSLALLRDFPRVEIRYNERLHAKFYQNDFEFIMTSLNLYDYSLANNIEVGVRSQYASKGLLGKAIDATNELVDHGIDRIKHDVIGVSKGMDPIEKFQLIFENAEIKYKTIPRVSSKSGFQGLIGKKELDGYDIVVNKLERAPVYSNITNQSMESVQTTVTTFTQTVVTETRCLSSTQLAKSIGLPGRDIVAFMEQRGLIDGDNITEMGKAMGIIFKTYMGKEYIAYPENLEIFKELR